MAVAFGPEGVVFGPTYRVEPNRILRPVIPSERLTHYGPVTSTNGGDASGLGSEAAPSVLAGVENGLVARKHAIGEEVLAQILLERRAFNRTHSRRA
jgi:hypothetical protein